MVGNWSAVIKKYLETTLGVIFEPFYYHEDNKFSMKPFYNRDGFPISVDRMTLLTINTPSKMFYPAF